MYDCNDDTVNRSLAAYWTLPELEPLREHLKHWIETVYPSVLEAEAINEVAEDPNSFWECWNYVLGMLSSKNFDGDLYWHQGVGVRIDPVNVEERLESFMRADTST